MALESLVISALHQKEEKPKEVKKNYPICRPMFMEWQTDHLLRAIDFKEQQIGVKKI